jgi:hypothetical protein
MWGWATAAAAIFGVSSAVWVYVELDRARSSTGQANQLAAQSRDEISALRRRIDDLSRPQPDVLIADVLPPDTTRGDRAGKPQSEQVIVVARDARWLTAILNLPQPPPQGQEFALEIRSDSAVVWQGGGLHSNRYNTVTIALPASLLPAGLYRFTLRAAASETQQPVQEYHVRIQYE